MPKPQTLSKMYESYITQRKSYVSPSTWKASYLVALRKIKRSPFAEVSSSSIDSKQAHQLCDWAVVNSTPDSARRLMMQLNACYSWAIAQGIVTVEKSPFSGLAREVRKHHRSVMQKSEIEFFTAAERDAIIQAFKESKHYSHYYNYVRFLFFTGCRPSEAIALRWSDVTPDFLRLTFRRAVIAGEKGRLHVRERLKTQKQRRFPCNLQLQEILADQRTKTDSELVFPSPKGGFICITNFQSRAWKAILSEMPFDYLSPYHTRHSFITWCLDIGLDAKDVARLVGNSAEIIYSRYAGSRSISVPTL